tara:strand:+ start:3167 stop:4570 length:1404 start_codon:yes stop_codon:yes gene_type:complete
MAYVINNTRGTALTTITDGTVDNTTTLQLFGKSYSGFGEGLNENLVKLLENSASTSAPSAPIEGELWFDTSTAQIKVYDGSSFKPTGGAKVQSTQPTSPSAGDLWQDSTNSQLYFYSGSAWILVGPQYTAGQTLSGWKIETVTASSVSKVISSMYVGNIRVAILSKETFTPDSAITGFASVSAGLTLNSTLGASFSGNSTQASTLDVSGTTNTSGTVIAGGNFLRADAADTTTGALTIDADGGIVVGDGQEFSITASTGNITLAQTSEDKNLSVTVNDGGVTKTPIAITGSTGNIALTGDVTITGNLNISGEYNSSVSNISTYDDAFIKVNSGNSEADSGMIVETSDTDDARMFYDVSENYWSAGENQTYSQIIRLADATTDGHANASKVLKVDGSGQVKVTTLTLGAVGSFALTDTSVATVPSTGAVATLMAAQQPLWGTSAKTVSTSAPTSGDGADGDFWFVREA